MKRVILGVAVVAISLGMTSCGGASQTTLTKGDKSRVDSLSYALGANVSYNVGAQLSEIPFNYSEMIRGVEEGAFGKGSMNQEEATPILRNYFLTLRGARAREVEILRDKADSVALANGADAAQVAAARAELPADDAMFVSVGERDSISYAFGIDMGHNLSESGLPVELVWLTAAMNDVFVEDDALMTAEQASAYIQNYFTVIVPAQNIEESEKWLADAAKARGAKVTESGLVYKIINKGDESMMATQDRDQVTVVYTGKTRKDKVFDTSRFADMTEAQKASMEQYDAENYGNDRDITFPLNGVIAGWTEGMKLVGKGGRIHLWIPAELAYGSQGAGRDIGANEALFFDVELLDVIPYAPMPVPSKEVEAAE